MEKLSAGAEAVIYRDGQKVIKERVSKGYRIPELDVSLRKFRTKREAKILEKFGYNVESENFSIKMDFIEGPKLKDVLTATLAGKIGEAVGSLHEKGIVHHDLTTSNMILNQGVVKLIDFGLSAFSVKPEDRAVDVHLFNRALESAHHEIHERCWASFLDGYRKSFGGANDVLSRLQVVSVRGRNKKK